MATTHTERISGSYLMPSLEHATVADAMHPGVLACDREATLSELARMMATHHVHCIAVMDGADGEAAEPFLWGIVTAFDVLEAGLLSGAEKSAAELARRATINIESTRPLRDAAQVMLDKREAHVIVTEPGTRRPVGVLSTLDIAGVLAWGEA